MAIIRQRAMSPGPGRRQVGGANRPMIARAYEADVLRKVADPALAAFGQQLGGQFGAGVGSGTAKGLLAGVSAKLVDQSVSPAMRAQRAQSVLESLRTRYGLESQAELKDTNRLRAAGVSPEDMQVISDAFDLYDQSLLEAYENAQR